MTALVEAFGLFLALTLSSTKAGDAVAPPAGADDILMETGDHLLLETGDLMLME